jgi:hypothetical protein
MPNYTTDGLEILAHDPSEVWGEVQAAIGVDLPLKDAVIVCSETGVRKTFSNAGKFANFVRRNRHLGLLVCMK